MLVAIEPKRHLGSRGRAKTLPLSIDNKQSHYSQELPEKSYFKAVAGEKKYQKNGVLGL